MNPILCKDRLELCDKGFGGEVGDLSDNQEPAIVVYHKQILVLFKWNMSVPRLSQDASIILCGDRISFCCELL